MLRRWCQEAQQRGGKAFPGAGTPHDQEVARLKRELALVTREQDVLQEAAAPTRRRVWQTSHGPVDVAGGFAGYSCSQTLEAAEIESTTGWDHQSTCPRLYSHRSECQMSHRHHVQCDAGRLALLGGRLRFVFAPSDRVVDATSAHTGSGHASGSDSRAATTE